MTQTATETITAPCGCAFSGRNHRIYDVTGCAVVANDPHTHTGRQIMQHAMKAKKGAK